MKDFVDDLVSLCRYFGMFERERVCCGSVTVQQCVVLQTLLNGSSEVGPLAEAVGNSPSAMTRLVDGLVSRGWVERKRDPQDRRCVHVTLTRDGKKEAINYNTGIPGDKRSAWTWGQTGIVFRYGLLCNRKFRIPPF